MKKIALLTLLLLIGYNMTAQRNYPKDSIIADFREYINFLEEVHLDPYSPFGGKIQFHKEVQNIIKKIPENGLNKSAFKGIISQFNSTLQDGHTFVLNENNEDWKNDKTLNIKFKIVHQGLSVSQSRDRKLNGSKIVSVNDVALDVLLNKVQTIKPCENLSGCYLALVELLMQKSTSEELLGVISNDKIKIEFLDNRKKKHIEYVEYRNFSDRKIQPNRSSFNVSVSKKIPFEYKYLDGKKKIILFTYNSTYSREVIEFQKQWGQDYSNNLNMLYQMFDLGDVPQDYTNAISKIPSLNETFYQMLKSMKQNESTHLIIDIRENGGGWNPINIPTLYMMRGDAYFGYDVDTEYITRISQPFLDKMNTSIEVYNKKNNTSYTIGDYSINKFFNSWDKNQSMSERRIQYLETNFSKDFSGINLLKELDGKALYTPKVVIVTCAATFSAAFQYAFLLKEVCNATVVGVPPSQAYNSGMGTTFYTLTRTGIKGSVSNSYQLFDPDNTVKDKMFHPDYPLSWEDFIRFDSDDDAEIYYILDLIKEGAI